MNPFENNLSDAQKELYEWIKSYMTEYHHSPSIRQMMQAMGLRSPAPIQSRLKHLQQKGFISWQEGKARTLQIVDEVMGSVPIMGSVAAGGLIETYSDVNENLDFSEILKKKNIFALTDLEHPCQALADFLTIHEEFLDFKDVILTFIGDGNNVANSLILCGALLGIEVRVACPKGYEPNPIFIERARKIYKNDNLLKITHDPNSAVNGANVLYTDVWSSMGEESKKEEKDKDFNGFTIDNDLVNKANKDAIILHCLPAYRNKEIIDAVIESDNSRIFEQAENRLHAQQALLACILQ